jgi:NitT/TauT family transport system substrate-binding protein
MVGYVFDGGWAQAHREALGRFFTATAKARQILADSPEEWQRLAPRIGTADPEALEIYRHRYLEGLPQRPLADEVADAKSLYRVLADIGGADLVGPAHDLDRGTFYNFGPSE